jgi:hypothetical protein
MPTKPTEKNEPKPFDWDIPLKTGQRIKLINRRGDKKHGFIVDGITDPKTCIRGEFDLAYEKWHSGSVMTSFALDEIPDSFQYLGKTKGIHQFQQIAYPSDKKPDFFIKEAGFKKSKETASKKS